MELPLTCDYLDLSCTLAKDLFGRCRHPWEALPLLAQYIMAVGPTLPKDRFDSPADGIWIAKSARVSPSAELTAPCIIDEEAELRHGAFVRGGVIVGKKAVAGNCTELKNSVLFDGAALPHFNYGGDSVFGFRAHLGAGAITSNVKSDRGMITVSTRNLRIPTGLHKFGAIVGDFAEIGCSCVLNPGSLIGRSSTLYPLSNFRGVLGENLIYKSCDNIVERWE